jgi:hypothetical protein
MGYFCEEGLKYLSLPGKMASRFGETDQDNLINCPEGFYCPAGTIVEVTQMIVDAGVDNPNPILCGLDENGEQIKKGVYCPKESSEPTECPAGEWFMSTGSVNASDTGYTCLPCPDGRACTKTGIFDPIEDTIKCSPGYYCYLGPGQKFHG